MQLSIPAALTECMGSPARAQLQSGEQETGQEAMWFLPTKPAKAEAKWLGAGCSQSPLPMRSGQKRSGHKEPGSWREMLREEVP